MGTSCSVIPIKMKAVVLGGSGAIGKEIIGELLTSDKWSSIISISRSPIDSKIPEDCKTQPTYKREKLQQRVIDLDHMNTQSDAFKDADAVFCALGTTRAQAGSAEQFKKVDFEYVKTAAELAKAGGARHFSLVSSKGANASVPASDLGLFHGLLYMKTKGLAEEAVKSQGMPRTSIFRPGLLDRGDLARGTEKWASYLFRKIDVRHVGQACVREAEKRGEDGVKLFEGDDLIRSMAAQQQ
eukprot:GDKI01026759.1.p1 GENE.GDKI01026759.1~~GDKI01026759.1.p1  ORF type:complete len:251 (-),score=66.13 GDKI01026759.1:189-911(-)